MVRAVRQRRLAGVAVLSGPMSWALVFLLVPYALLLAYSFYRREFPTWERDFVLDNYSQVFGESQYRTALLRTTGIALAVACFALLLAYPVAYFLAFRVRSNRLRALLFFGMIVPLWVSYLLRLYTWKTILGSNGALNSFLIWVGVTEEPVEFLLYSRTAMVITLTYIFIPFVALSVFAQLEKLPRSLPEAARDLGASPWHTFTTIVLPLSIPGVLAGATIAFCLAFGDFIAAFLVGGPGDLMVANLVQTQFGSALNWPLGAALSMLILVVVVAVLTLANRLDRFGNLDLD